LELLEDDLSGFYHDRAPGEVGCRATGQEHVQQETIKVKVPKIKLVTGAVLIAIAITVAVAA